MSILVVGSVALDTIRTPRAKASRVLGGSASYFSISAAAFADVRLVAVVGRDFPGRHLRLFKRKGIDLSGLQAKAGKTFFWEGEYGWDFGDPKTLTTDLNVFAHFQPKIPSSHANSDFVFLANIDPQQQLNVLRQVNKPRLIACDTMNYWIEHKPAALRKLLRCVDICFLNVSEAKQLTGKVNSIAAGKAVLKMGPEVVVVKKGENGVLLFSENHMFAAPAYLLESIVDPTGAGDTFAGGFMGYLSRCRKINQSALRTAVIYGSVMATFTVEDFSLRRLASIGRADIRARLRQFEKYTCFES